MMTSIAVRWLSVWTPIRTLTSSIRMLFKGGFQFSIINKWTCY